MARPRNEDRAKIRDQRISLAVPFHEFHCLKLLATIRGISVNEMLAGVISELVHKNLKTILEFDAAQRKAAEAVDMSVGNESAQIDSADHNSALPVATEPCAADVADQ